MCGMRARTPEEAEANARLIAAAPDMLAALREILFARPLGPLPETKLGKLVERLESIARDAVAKAEHPLVASHPEAEDGSND